jgi:ParB family chromosome partitioning protein
MSEKKRTVQKWKLSKLKDYPKQAEMFGAFSEVEIAALAADMHKNGQRVPIEILPDGTIIAGHKRVRAARLLGWTHIDAIVRNDLADAGSDAVEEAFISDNLVRRHLSPLARARAMQRLMELELSTDNIYGDSKEALKCRIATQLSLSPRSVNRYLLVLQTPPAVQAAFDSGAISLIKAGRVALLTDAEQRTIAERLDAGESPREVIAAARSRNTLIADLPDTAFRRFLRALQRELPLIAGHEREINPKCIRRHKEILERVIKLIREITKRNKEG